jgi:hypothetical protein
MESLKTIQRYRLSFAVSTHDYDDNIYHDRLRAEDRVQIQLLLHYSLPMYGNPALLHLFLFVLIHIMDHEETLG